ncbi:MAG: lipoyl protein ligase domain-containing protein, partial [Opitutales bacterium]
MFATLPNAYGDAATNMAVDAALLQSLPEGVAVLRHYGWIEPSLSFGYAQPYAQVAAAAPPGVRLVRRLTGGGLVDHRNDWT